MRAKAIPHLRKFCQHEKPQIRAAAIGALCQAAPDDAETELIAALGDQQSEVRIAGASAILRLLDDIRQNPVGKTSDIAVVSNLTGVVITDVVITGVSDSLLSKAVGWLADIAVPPAVPPAPVAVRDSFKPAAPQSQAEAIHGKTVKEEVDQRDQWLTEIYARRHRPEWTSQATPLLEKMLAAASVQGTAGSRAPPWCRWERPLPPCR